MTESLDHDHIALRLVTALDALPVPEEPTGLRATVAPSLARQPWLMLALALALVVVITTSPQFQRAATELGWHIERTFSGPSWVGYYHDHTLGDPSGHPAIRLLRASGDGRGSPTTPEIVGQLVAWQWSPDGQQIAVSSDSQLYVGDESGRLRRIADVGLGRAVLPLGWAGNGSVWATEFPMPDGRLAELGGERSLLRVDLVAGVLERHELENLPAKPVVGISPDGRWLSVGSGPPEPPCGYIVAVYELGTRRLVDVVDASGRPASAFGFLGDGRIVIGQCDLAAQTVELYVGTPGAQPTFIASVPLAMRRPVIALGNVNDEILVVASGPDAPQNAYVFDASGRLLRTLPLPRVGSGGAIGGSLSRDGRFLAFDVTASSGRPRSGVVDLTTGRVTYLCDSDCDYLTLR